jgi:hypothetical protein
VDPPPERGCGDTERRSGVGPGGSWEGVALATCIVLADVAQRLEQGLEFEQMVPGSSWDDLAAHLLYLDQMIHDQVRERARVGRSAATGSPLALEPGNQDRPALMIRRVRPALGHRSAL